MPLNDSEKDSKDSIVQSLGTPFKWNEKEKAMCGTLKSFCVHEEKCLGFNQGRKISFSHTAFLTVALETCLHAVAQL